MGFPILLVITLTLLALILLVVAADNNSMAAGHIALDCGASGRDNDNDGRTWDGDTSSKLAPLVEGVTATASYQDLSLPSRVPYMTARIFTSDYTYSFPVSAGRMFVRLYFYPITYGNYAVSDAFFRVTAGNLVLLNDFNASQTAQAIDVGYLVREFSLNVSSGSLDLTFAPSEHQNGAYAFVNGIEIVPTPDIFTTADTRFVKGDNPAPFSITTDRGFQTMYRINVGGPGISPKDDSSFYRSWANDSPYMFGGGDGYGVTFIADSNLTIKYTPTVPYYTAPIMVYDTARSIGPIEQLYQYYNLTWILPVDAGFLYLLRFHLCEIQDPITKVNQRTFFIYINNQTAQRQMDVIARSGGIGRTTHTDYVIGTTGYGQVDMRVALYPDISSKPENYDVILNGLEIFKLQDYGKNNLAGLSSPLPQQTDSGASSGGKSRGPVLAAICGSAVGGFVVVLMVCFGVCIICRRKKKISKDTTGSHTSTVPSNLCRHFSFAQVQAATNNFDQAFLLGKGGFGNVYLGEIDGGTKLAIKRCNPMSEQGVDEFQTEIEMLSKLRHRHLVSLVGYCEDKNEMILVYDYMTHGTLREHLYKTKNPPLSWKQRLEICIGAARGLHYLHTGVKPTIIHRDIKSTNILLGSDDGIVVAKVADFGLSRTGPSFGETHVSTTVKGSFGYLDPEYFKTQQLTDRSDVYSFGVVLLEVLCARPVIDQSLDSGQINLADWAVRMLHEEEEEGRLGKIADARITGQVNENSLRKFAETAEKCLADYGVDRPSMAGVLWNLEYCLQLQKTHVGRDAFEDSGAVTTTQLPTGVVVPRWLPSSTSLSMDDDTGMSTQLSAGGEGR